ncbi:CinA family protein [Daejeonella lutea]|uniref:Nicotinamide-nucleotide amidase n=1 Tax=Daejeonella lutea TaxID=572036 RepID=A0A1T5D1S6_9SPHI|nr:CinA family protein [Daejeonella lutea]SKB65450.1 nicotinamide-nucleotide amidase [Daejeonella lutea]
MPSTLVLESCKALAANNLTITFAESATAGSLCAAFAMAPQSGQVLKGGIVCYDAVLKEHILHIPPGIIKKYTPESAEVTEQLSRRLKKLIKADVYVAVTGLTTSGGSETPEKPVGTMFMHMIWEEKSLGLREVYRGKPEDIIAQAVDRVARMVLDLIRDVKKVEN